MHNIAAHCSMSVQSIEIQMVIVIWVDLAVWCAPPRHSSWTHPCSS